MFALVGNASQLTAALQSGNKLTPFYGSNAFVEAYNAAADGDVITLSPGSFNAVADINKSITVIGSFAFRDDTSLSTVIGADFKISANGVTIEGVRCNNVLTIKGADNLTINRSYFSTLSDEENGEKKIHDNTILTDCMIAVKYDAMSLSKNTVLRNCSINYFSDVNSSTDPAIIENCNITTFAYWNGSGLSSSYTRPYAIYRNCFLGLYNYGTSAAPVLQLYSPSEFHDVIFFSNFYDSRGNSNAKSWTIQFNSCIKNNAVKNGTKYGIGGNLSNSQQFQSFLSYKYGNMTVGPVEHKSYPAIPEISSSEIDTETDADGNIHVKITATARD